MLWPPSWKMAANFQFFGNISLTVGDIKKLFKQKLKNIQQYIFFILTTFVLSLTVIEKTAILMLKNLIFYFLPYTVCVWRKYCDGKKTYFDMFVKISVLRSAESKKVGYKKCRSIFYMCVSVCVPVHIARDETIGRFS